MIQWTQLKPKQFYYMTGIPGETSFGVVYTEDCNHPTKTAPIGQYRLHIWYDDGSTHSPEGVWLSNQDFPKARFHHISVHKAQMLATLFKSSWPYFKEAKDYEHSDRKR